MQTSDKGRAALLLEEGDVLRAYRDVAGVWTISGGLTAASGVVTPKAGMVITTEESARLMSLALSRNYEPAVARAMPAAPQSVFDAGVSFHFNTGAIGRASWVKAWAAKAAPAVIRDKMCLWVKAGGKVLPSLKARRLREAAMLLDGVYRTAATSQAIQGMAKWGLSLTAAEIAAVRNGLRTLGYDAGPNPAGVLSETARQFQRDHGLTVDGILGRASLTTLQRRLDARTRAATAAVVSAPAGASTGTAVDITQMPWIETAVWLGIALWALWLAWRYRDVIAAKINGFAPRAAVFLRSF